jgi:hypothetical protein
MIRPLLPIFLGLHLAPILPAADPVISEFMASNQSSVTDEDGDRPDWIEIRNPGPDPVSLGGWFLTDTAANTSKWTFPAITLPPNGHLLVWASGKDRRSPEQPLHTNFSLAADGEYLALIKPNGQTATTAFAPVYPPQFPDVAYGTSKTATELTVLDKPTAVKAFVPADNTLGAIWRAPGFNDTSWLDGTFAVGFMNYNNGSNPNLQGELGTDLIGRGTGIGGTGASAYARARFTITNPAAVVSLALQINYDDGFHAWINGGTSAASSPNAPAEGTLGYNSTAGSHSPNGFETFDLSAKISSLVAGTNVLALQVLNTGGGSSDLFASARLVAGIDSGGAGVTGYFSTATPGAANGGTHTIQLPQTVTYSRPPGTFTAPFELALSGADDGQEIRYVAAAPSGAGAVLAEPTLASPLYTGPIPVSTSLLVRAAIFNTTNGQRSRSRTAHYVLLETAAGANNTSNFTSILPILVSDTHGGGQPPDSDSGLYKSGLLHLFEPTAGTTSLAGTPTTFTRTGLRVRGSSSAGFPKSSYGLETWSEQDADQDEPLLDLPADSDWVLNGPWLYDNTFIHNAYIYDLSRQIGRWAPRTRFVEMFDNRNGGKLDFGDYAGVYVLTEKIKSTAARVDVTGLEPADVTGDAVTGGYIFKIDRPDGDEVQWQTSNGVPNQESGQSLVVVEPDPQTDVPAQITYLQNHVQAFDTTLFAERAANFATRNYRTFIDTPAWIDHHILNAVAYNVDALRLSGYYFKDRGRKIHAGPIWDFDRALGSDDGRDFNPASWSNIEYFFNRDWWGQLFRDPDFVQAWVDRWTELRQTTFAQSNLNSLADRMGAEIGNAAGARDAAKWPENAARGRVFLNEITDMKSWLNSRMTWINNQIPAAPTASLATGVTAAGSTVTLSGTGPLLYTLDGTDPRPGGGGATGPGKTYTGPLTLTATSVLTARRLLASVTTVFTGQSAIGTRWSAPVRRVYLVDEEFAAPGDLAVSEINYHPFEPTPVESAAVPGLTASDFEWIELRNIGARTVNLFAAGFADTKPFNELKLAAFTLAPGATALVVKNRAAFIARHGSAQASRIVGEWGKGSLDDNGETIALMARDGATIQTFAYDDEDAWPGRADGKGSTLEYAGTVFADADFNTAENWRSSSEVHGSPGTVGAGPDRSVAINEILTQTSLPYLDAVELRNLTAAPIDLGGWYLSNVVTPETADSYKLFRIPDGTVVPGGGWVVFDERDFNPNGTWNPAAGPPGPTEFSFDGDHDTEVWLIAATTSGALRFVDRAEVGPARLNESIGREPDGTGAFVPMARRTAYDETSGDSPRPKLGAANSAVRVGPVLIHEVHHSPTGGSTTLEFVELYNPTTDPVPLDRWRLRGNADFDFTTESIPPGGLLVVVPFAPTDLALATAFRAAYGLADDIALTGPWSSPDTLGLPGECSLYRAALPPPLEPGYFPLTLEDETDYLSGDPWPETSGGLALNRLVPAGDGDAPASWRAAPPSPGSLTAAMTPSFAEWTAGYFPAGGPGSGPTDDPDADGISNLFEYATSSHPLVANPSPLPPPNVALATEPAPPVYSFTYTRPLETPSVSWSVESSSTLEAWQPVPDSQVSTTATTETRRAVVEATTPRIYFRIRVTTTP